MLTDSDRYQLLKALEQNPNLSQRQLASELGYSLGKLNYCLRALMDKGWVKTENFRNNQNKSAYLYQLTPTGITEKARVTQRFLQRKLEEHQQIEQEIEALKHEVAQQPEI
jgi:EPS-associated MarR family transcriptional regulator